MKQLIRIKKGLDIRLEGAADGSLRAPTAFFEDYGIRPSDFYGLRPKLLVKEGDKVLAGSPLFFDKNQERLKITSPVSGVVSEIVYGPKRKIEEIRLKADKEMEYAHYSIPEAENLNRENISSLLLESGLWSYIRQRPYDVIAHPEKMPKAIVISAFDTAPLAPDNDILVHGREEAFQKGVDIIKYLSQGPIYLNIHQALNSSKIFLDAKNVVLHTFSGPHPAGNVSVQIHHIDPINKGEEIWYVHPQDVITIGQFFLSGQYDATKIIALAGSEVIKTSYYKILSGIKLSYLLEDNIKKNEDVRIISGNVLSGTRQDIESYLGAYDHLITVIPEGNNYRFLGWMSPGLNTYSFSHTFLSSLFRRKEYKIDSNLNGGRRALVVSGVFEKVFPMDIYPMQLIKACLIKDIERMEYLGIYEVAPEDFALCEYIDVSKTEIQQLIRESLDYVCQEMN